MIGESGPANLTGISTEILGALFCAFENAELNKMTVSKITLIVLFFFINHLTCNQSLLNVHGPILHGEQDQIGPLAWTDFSQMI